MRARSWSVECLRHHAAAHPVRWFTASVKADWWLRKRLNGCLLATTKSGVIGASADRLRVSLVAAGEFDELALDRPVRSH
jgi:hypothetical protein